MTSLATMAAPSSRRAGSCSWQSRCFTFRRVVGDPAIHRKTFALESSRSLVLRGHERVMPRRNPRTESASFNSTFGPRRRLASPCRGQERKENLSLLTTHPLRGLFYLAFCDASESGLSVPILGISGFSGSPTRAPDFDDLSSGHAHPNGIPRLKPSQEDSASASSPGATLNHWIVQV